MKRIRTVADIVEWRLCLGCGACAAICPSKIQLLDFPNEGIRPVVSGADCGRCADCVRVCPVVETDFPISSEKTEPALRLPDGFKEEWGQVLGIWVGHASDSDIRFKGSSGGVLTAISAFCIECLEMDGVLHVGSDPEDPTRNRTRLSRTRADLLGATGSRYSPASVCNGLGLVECSHKPIVIVGKPVEIAAVRRAQKMRPQLDRNVGLTLSFFCAETPATKGTLDLLQRMGIRAVDVADLRYRGEGWPGHFIPLLKGQAEPAGRVSYRESWAYLQAYRPWQTQFWPDGSGELADISCGDPWYEEPDGKNPGTSLVIARTERGMEIIRAAIAAGYLTLQPGAAWMLPKSQRGLLEKKGAIWGRRLAVQLLRLPVTRFSGAGLRHCWRLLSLGQRVKAFIGTIRRAIQRGVFRRLVLDVNAAVPVQGPWIPSPGESARGAKMKPTGSDPSKS